MSIKTFLLASIAFLGLSGKALADSPLTSTAFYSEYTDQPIITKAAAANGSLTVELMDYLYDSKNPIDVKMAVINQLSWSFEGKTNAPTFLKYILKKGKYGTEENFRKKGTTHELLCMAYMLGLDNYFDVAPALVYADIIGERVDPSYTVRLIVAIIRAQDAMATSWCDVYTYTNEVRNDETLTFDMRPAASRVIFEYMDLYGEDCGGSEEEGSDSYMSEYYEEGQEDFYSPLTATPFASYYAAEAPLITTAIESMDPISEEMVLFLADEKRPIEQKVALINGLGNHVDGSANGDVYLEYILKKGAFKDAEDFKTRGKVRDLLCVAYLKAMDNVYDVSAAMEYVYAIRSTNPTGYTVNLICAMIESQQYLTSDNWCLVYSTTNYVRENTALRMDMKEEVSQIIFGYMDQYQVYCEEIEEIEYDEEGGE